jgi:hypothetical protein
MVIAFREMRFEISRSNSLLLYELACLLQTHPSHLRGIMRNAYTRGLDWRVFKLMIHLNASLRYFIDAAGVYRGKQKNPEVTTR